MAEAIPMAIQALTATMVRHIMDRLGSELVLVATTEAAILAWVILEGGHGRGIGNGHH